MSQLPDLQPDPSPEDVLASALDHFERIALATSLGPQTLVVLDLLHRMGRSVPVFLLDTGLLFEETLALKARVEERYGLEIRSVRPELSVEGQAAHHGDALWRRDPDRCCHLRKVLPLRRTLAGLDAWITGLRRDQSATRAAVRPIAWDRANGLYRVSPLAGWSREQVLDHLRAHDVPYNPLLERGYPSVGCWPCTRAVRPDDDERAGRWADREKTECGIHFLLPPTENDR